MLHPSYSELMAVVNSGVEEGEQLVVSSRYSIVKATAARAKQIIDARSVEEKVFKNMDKEGRPAATRAERQTMKIGTPLVDNADSMKPLSVAVQELYEGQLKIVNDSEEE